MNPGCRAILTGLWFSVVWLLHGQQGETLPTLGYSPGNGETNVLAKPLLQWQSAGLTNLVKNGRFTEGLTNWTATGIWVTSAISGARSSGSASVEVLPQELELPADAVGANAAWDYAVPPGRLSLGSFQVEIRDLNDVRLALLQEVGSEPTPAASAGQPRWIWPLGWGGGSG